MKLKNKSGENNVPPWQNANFTCPACLDEYVLEKGDVLKCEFYYKKDWHRRTDIGLIKYMWHSIFGKTFRKTEQKMLYIETNCPNCLNKIKADIPLGEEEFVGYV